MASAERARGAEMGSILGELEAVATDVPHGFLVGDFNEPSHLDWSAEAAAAGLHFGLAVPWPTSRTAEGAGLVDVYRAFQERGEEDGGSVDALLLDGMHPNAAGHRLVANLLKRCIVGPGETLKEP